MIRHKLNHWMIEVVGYLLDIDIWQSGTTRVMQDGVVIKGLAPRRLDPARYHLNPSTDLNELEKGMPWRTIQDEFGSSSGSIMQAPSIKGLPSRSNLMLRPSTSLLQA